MGLLLLYIALLHHKIQFFKIIYLILERGEGREKGRERNINVWLPLAPPLLGTWPTTQASALTGNRSSNLLICRPALSPLSRTSQELHPAFPGPSSAFCTHVPVPLFPGPSLDIRKALVERQAAS